MDNTELTTESIIDPENWTHLAIVKAIESLALGENMEMSFNKYMTLVNVAEAIARGQGRLTDEYNNELQKYLDSNEHKGKTSGKNLAECTKKIELISKAIAETTTMNMPLIMGKGIMKEEDESE